MPQACDEDRARYLLHFPDIGCEHGIRELEKRGYELTRQWTWKPPAAHKPSDDELFWIDFLVLEWDFGGLEMAQDYKDVWNEEYAQAIEDGVQEHEAVLRADEAVIAYETRLVDRAMELSNVH